MNQQPQTHKQEQLHFTGEHFDVGHIEIEPDTDAMKLTEVINIIEDNKLALIDFLQTDLAADLANRLSNKQLLDVITKGDSELQKLKDVRIVEIAKLLMEYGLVNDFKEYVNESKS